MYLRVVANYSRTRPHIYMFKKVTNFMKKMGLSKLQKSCSSMNCCTFFSPS